MKSESIRAVAHEWRTSEADPAAIVSIVRDAIALFGSTDWGSRNPTLHALVVVITEMPPHHWWMIDEGHRLAKGAAVEQGTMVGQFHPNCDAPAARNPLFPVNRAPFPMFAIRNMAFHDILFLHEDPEWFEQYRSRYGHVYSNRAAAKLDSHFARLYQQAVDASDAIRPRRPQAA